MNARYEVKDASAVTGTCRLLDRKTGKSLIVELDGWNWRNSFSAEIFFKLGGREFSVVTDMEADYPDI